MAPYLLIVPLNYLGNSKTQRSVGKTGNEGELLCLVEEEGS